ncbi:MAG: hypothetical protein GY759_09220 [Chloroflexi bacterium]|nr:hypothetical protein [Chloroflexota bacterium]
MTLEAGAAYQEITPQKPMFLFGYPHVTRTSTGVHDPLYASALYLHDGIDAILFVAVDVLMLSHDTVRRCRAEISQATAVPEGNILISTTHTHSAPPTIEILAFRDDPVVPPIDQSYMERVCQGIITAASEAHQYAVPARAAATSAIAEGVGGNRHREDGPSDPEVGLLYVQAQESGEPLALSMTYCMHPTVLHEDSTLVSSDFPGYVRACLTEHLPGVKVLYHTGPSGNQSPRYHVSSQTFAEAQRLGYRLADAVIAAVEALQPTDFSDRITISGAQAFVELPVRRFPPPARAERMLSRAIEAYERLKSEGAPHGPVRTAECTIFGTEEQVVLAKAQESGELDALRRNYTPTEVQVLRVGDTFFAGLAGEYFVEYGLELKNRAPGGAVVISLANGELQGYIVTPEASGYEAAFSLWAPQAGAIIIDEALRLMNKLKKQ